MTHARLGDILVRRGVIDAEKLQAALADQQAFGGKLGRTLVDLGYIDEAQLVLALAEQLGLQTVDLGNAELDPEALRFLPVDACERYGVIPVRVDLKQSLLWVATAEPDRAMLQDVAQIAQLTLEPMLAPMSAIDRAVRKYYYGEKAGPKARLGEPMRSIPPDPGAAKAKRPSSAGQPPGAPAAAPQHTPAPPVAAQAPAAAPAPAPTIPAAPHPQDSLDLLPEAVVVGEAARLTGIAPAPRATSEVAELRVLLVRLEKAVSAQGRAFRALVELLQDKGVVRRGELGARTNKKA